MTREAAVVGAGYMGGGIAQVLAFAGFRVGLADTSAEVAERNLSRLIDESRTFEAGGFFPDGATQKLEMNLWAASSIEEAVKEAVFIEEAVPEVIEIKQSILERISAAAPSAAVIGSNTSTISISDLAVAVQRPERFLGIHFINPAPFVPGVEVIPHSGTDERALALARSILDDAGKVHATVKDTAGFVVNRVQYALFSEAARLVEEGVATPEAIDTLVRTTFGFRLPLFGPFAIADMAGLDVYAFCYQSLESAFPERFHTPRLLRDLVDAGKLGAKTGSGFYDASAESVPELVAYRNKAYVLMSRLIEELGPAPK